MLNISIARESEDVTITEKPYTVFNYCIDDLKGNFKKINQLKFLNMVA